MSPIPTPAALVQDIRGLVTLPDVYLRITALVDAPDSSAADIARAAGQDPSFAARLLQVANSALYGFSGQIATVARAVTVIGTSQIRHLALAMSVASSFAGLPNELVSMRNFWRHSLYCALIARHLAREARRADPDALFTAGLLHDIGALIVFNRLPAEATEALTRVLDSGDELPVHEAERQVLGYDHADVGGELARLWKLPPLIVDCVAHHHDIAAAKAHPRETALVHLANGLALMAEIGSLDPADVSPLDPRAWEITGLDEECLGPAVAEAQGGIEAAERLFGGGS